MQQRCCVFPGRVGSTFVMVVVCLTVIIGVACSVTEALNVTLMCCMSDYITILMTVVRLFLLIAWDGVVATVDPGQTVGAFLLVCA